MTRYSYSLQYADSELHEADDKGIASPADILAAFDAFDWAGQARAASRRQKCSPTFSVREADGKRVFWASAYGEPDLRFANDYSETSSTRELSLTEARRAVQLFVDADDDALRDLLTSPGHDDRRAVPAKSAKAARAEADKADKAYISRRSVFDGAMLTVVGIVVIAGMSYFLFADSEMPLVFTVPLTAGGLIVTYVGTRILIGKMQGQGTRSGSGTGAI